MAVLCMGAISGSIGASAVFPLNVLVLNVGGVVNLAHANAGTGDRDVTL
jgi:hypothetical protein